MRRYARSTLWFALSIPFMALGQAALADMYSDCDKAVQRGKLEKAREYAELMKRFSSVSGTEKQTAGARCLTFAMNEPWVYSVSLGKFASSVEDAATLAEGKRKFEKEAADRVAQEAARQKLRSARVAEEAAQKAAEEAAKQSQLKRELIVWQAVSKACSDIYADDPNSALTNKVCIDLFIQIGLPR